MDEVCGDIAIIVGSLRRASFSRKLATILCTKLKGRGTILEIGDLPLYNDDLEENAPLAWRAFRDAVRASRAVLFVTPEYNRSIPASLKNAVDVGSRPMKQGVWLDKPAGIISLSRGAMGGFGAHHHLRQSLVGVNMPVMPHPEMYIGGAANLFGLDGTLANPDTHALLDEFVSSFCEWIAMSNSRAGASVNQH